MKIETIIIGGGLSGCYIANRLNKKEKEFFLLECSYRLGGRHLTIKNKNKVEYESGAWRIHSSHNRMIKLIKELGLNMTFFEKSNIEKKEGIIGLSNFDNNLIKNNGELLETFEEELKTGYQSIYDSPYGSHPYNSKKEGEFFTIDEGQEEIIKKLSENFKDKIKLNHKVSDIVRENGLYKLTILCSSKNKIIEKIIYCKYLFSCIPQFDSWSWTISQKYLYPLLNSVKPIPLMHIYVKGDEIKNIEQFRKIPNNFLQQIIPPTHLKDTAHQKDEGYQISYSAGRIAQFWYNYKLKFGDKKLKNFIENYTGLKFKKMESYFWSHAFHIWLTTPDFNLKKLVYNSISPNPIKLPNFWWSGECFSSFQGWGEGALETSDMALIDFFNGKNNWCHIYKKIPKNIKEWMIFDNRILDVKKWKNVHPGSKESIINHLGEDISKIFRYIKHSELSWASLYSIHSIHCCYLDN